MLLLLWTSLHHCMLPMFELYQFFLKIYTFKFQGSYKSNSCLIKLTDEIWVRTPFGQVPLNNKTTINITQESYDCRQIRASFCVASYKILRLIFC